MKNTSNWKSLVVLLALVTLSSSIRAEEDDHSTDGTTKADTTVADSNRPKIPNDLKERELKLLSKSFSHPPEVIIQKFGKSIPDALQEAIKTKDQSSLNKLVMELYGTISNKQLAALVPKPPDAKGDLEKAMDAEFKKQSDAAKAEDRPDDRYKLLSKTIFVIGKFLNGDKVKTADAEAINKEVATGFKEVQKKGKEVRELIEAAKQPNNTPAKEKLREMVNRSGVMSFIDEQRKNGNTKGAVDLTKALAFRANDQNDLYLDLFGPKGTGGAAEPQRLHLGKSDGDIQKSLEGFSKARETNGGFKSTALASKTHAAAPTGEWFMQSGKFTKGKPAGVDIPVTSPQVAKVAAAAGGGARVAGGGTGAPAGGPAAAAKPTSAPVGGPSITEMQEFMTAKCKTCHGVTVTGTDIKNARIDAQSAKGKTLAEVVAAIERPGSSMQGKVDTAKLKEWAAMQ